MRYILLSLVFLFNITKSHSQNNGALAGALLVGGLGIIASIEKNKEVYENLASNYIISNYPEYKQFRLKVIGTGLKGNKISDDGDMNIVPFKFTKLENGVETDDRKVLVLFIDRNNISENGVSFQNFKYEFWDIDFWNSIFFKFSQLNSPINLDLNDNLIPVFKSFVANSTPEGAIVIKNEISKIETAYVRSTIDKKDVIHLGKLKYTKEGLRYKSEVVFPFYILKGDDYLIDDFNDEIRLVSNERSLGLFRTEFGESILVKKSIVNKIHNFLNFIDDSE